MTLNSAIQDLRVRLGESQQIFATKLGISISGLVNYERDAKRVPQPAVLLALTDRANAAGYEDLEKVFSQAFMKDVLWSLHHNGRGRVRLWQKVKDEDGTVSDMLVSIGHTKQESKYVETFYQSLILLDSPHELLRSNALAVLDAMYRRASGK